MEMELKILTLLDQVHLGRKENMSQFYALLAIIARIKVLSIYVPKITIVRQVLCLQSLVILCQGCNSSNYSCTEGQTTQTSFTGLVVIAILDLILVLLYYKKLYNDKKRIESVDILPFVSSDVNTKTDKSIVDPKLILAENFKKSMNGESLRILLLK